MSLVLLMVIGISFGIGSYVEGVVVFLVFLLNVVLGVQQELKAEQRMSSLRSLSAPTANVVRDGRNATVPAGEVVGGAMLELTTGDTVPADIRYGFPLDSSEIGS